MNKVSLKICCGTTCYLLGAKKLVDLASALPADVKDRVEVSAMPCLGLCEDDNLGGAPFVKVDEEIVAKATAEKVMDVLRRHLGEVRT